jgi:fluoride exporter
MKLGPMLLVGIGGFIGAVARFAIGTFAVERWGRNWPFGTFIINISGCFMIAFFLTLTAERVTLNEAWRYIFPIGFVGAYTTFSTYEFETMQLLVTGAWARAISYVVLSTVVGLAAVFFAAWVARRF